ncbi:hypothetical protein BN2476_350245 [Paraburkholderia piptadeniae]|uniref:Uncharacterized protein n=1 Tax=Paraburkholderia piptadeniae TaxID=1701573 RepID=A0A1N7S8I1_9BURK|nr:hypothetical protein [Paraburkholderia piptadeniae]SIT43700.1 hypothetical protein BN2476_350245 [Paraburkholderia piptadeniae]
MRMTFIIPAAFTVYDVPQRDRPPCVLELEVIELVRMHANPGWRFRKTVRRGGRVTYTAYVRLPGWITAPEKWPRLETGEVEITVPMHFNQRAAFPEFPPGKNRVRLDDVLQLRGEPC